MPADLGRRWFRDDGRRHADIPVRLRPAVRAADLAGSARARSAEASSTGSFPAGTPDPWGSCSTNRLGQRPTPGRPRSCSDLQRRHRPGTGLGLPGRTPVPRRETPGNGIDGHVDPRQIMDVGVMNGNIPAPMMAIDEDDEFFLTLTNVGHDHAARSVRAAHGALPRLSERLRVLRRRAGCFGRDQHRRQLHLLLPGAGRRHVLLALPHHAARAPADGHGRADLRAAAAEPRAGRQACCAALWAQQGDLRTTFATPRTTSSAATRCRAVDTGATRRTNRRAHRDCTPTTTATARPPTTSSIPSRSTVSIPTSTSSA